MTGPEEGELVETLVLVVHCLDLDRRGDLFAALRDEALNALHDAYRTGRYATDQATHRAVLNELHLRRRAGRGHMVVVKPQASREYKP